MSARAASRLETLGFQDVYRYTGGKMEWSGYGLPVEGRLARVPRALDAMRRNLPTCSLPDRLGPVRERVRAARWDVCIVVNEERVVLGILEGDAWNAKAEAGVQEVMREGPSTFRPDVPLERLFEYLQKSRYQRVVVTNPDGQLIGMVYLADAEKRWKEYQRSQSPAGNDRSSHTQA